MSKLDEYSFSFLGKKMYVPTQEKSLPPEKHILFLKKRKLFSLSATEENVFGK